MIQAASNRNQITDLTLAEELFAGQFDLWEFHDRWHCTQRHAMCQRERSVDYCLRLLELLGQACTSTGIQLHRLDSFSTLCLLPLCSPGHRAVAVRRLDSNSDELLALVRRSAEFAVKERERTEQVRKKLAASNSKLAAWTSRISQGKAELAWLHGLSTGTELSGTEGCPRRVAERILPDMCRLIRANTVAFVEETVPSCADIWQTGNERISADLCGRLITESAAETGGPPRIANYTLPKHADSTFSGVLSCIVKTVTKDAKPVGWIVAVNKDLRHLASDTGRIEATLRQECEFGTFESGLVEAAANAFSAHARNSSLLKDKEMLVEGAIRSLVNAIDAKDSYTFGHSDRVAEYAREIASTLGMDEQFCRQIYMTGLLHDVGKIGVPDHVLQKPGRLTDEEFDKIKEHPVIGHEILRHLVDFDYVLPGVLHHHESVDGTGYPHGLKGDEIPLMARILAVADAYDAMTSDRPYRDGMPPEKAAAIIKEGAGQQWDVECVEAFRRCISGIRLIGHHRHEDQQLHCHT